MKTGFFAIALTLIGAGVSAQETTNTWVVNPMPICVAGRCAPEGMADTWGPYPDEATCLARIEEMVETLNPVLFLMFNEPMEIQPRGCTNTAPGEEI